MTKKAFLIHGWTGTLHDGWLSWLKRRLEEKGFKVTVPAMPDTNHPKIDAWVNHLAKVVKTPDKGCYFIGHSLGCITILRYLETLKENQTVGGVILVAEFADNFGEKELYSFFAKPIEWDKIKSHCKKFVAIHSDNDYHVPLEHADIFKKKLNAKLIVQRNMKHFSDDDGVVELPVAFDSVLRLSK
ncbi:serine hydrolase family protein [archaeon]|nr:MAG: serine hydrolase family protein [archaeon]